MGDKSDLRVTLDDLQHHVIKYGLNVFPQPDVRNERTRAHDLFQSLQEKWPRLYQELSFTPELNQFNILANFRFDRGQVKAPTLVFTQQGPVFAFPIRLPDPMGDFHHDHNLEEVFLGSLALLQKSFPGTQVLRVGLVRELMFEIGQTDPIPFLSERFGSFPNAESKGGTVKLTFRDGRCNINVAVETAIVQRQHRMHGARQPVSDEQCFGFKVTLDVNNVELRSQSPEDIEWTLKRADGLFPKALLQFMNWGGEAS